YGTLRLLELACMLALRPSLLLLDEPSSGISQKETEALGPLLRDIKARMGATMLIIEHDMPLVMGLSDWMYCLDAGRNLAAGAPASSGPTGRGSRPSSRRHRVCSSRPAASSAGRARTRGTCRPSASCASDWLTCPAGGACSPPSPSRRTFAWAATSTTTPGGW